MAIIGTAYVHIRADDKYFESDVRKAVAKIKNTTIKLNADVDISKASKKIRDLRYRITSKDAVLQVDADVAKAETKLTKLLAKFLKNDVEFNAVANTATANASLSALKNRYNRNNVNIKADADTARAEAQLNATARNRKSKIDLSIDKDVQKGLQGLLNTITGTIPAEKIKGALVGVASNFEGLALKATVATTAIFALSGALLTTAANAFSIAGDLTQVIGLFGVFPAAVFGVVTAVKATTLAWKGFGDAMKDAKTPAQLKEQQAALAKLPPEAQKAVKALKEIRGEVQKPVQKAYWEAMGTSLQDLIAKKFPELKKGMTDVAGGMGRWTSALFGAIGKTDDFNDVFVNVTDTIDNLKKGLDPAIDALSRWIGIGSSYLPQFGNWVSDLATKFGEWTKEAEETGKMNQWIDTGIQRVKELGSIVKSTVGIFGGLTTAARAAGAPGLTEMAESMRNIRDIVNGEPFQSRLIIILEGARAGVQKLKDGFGELTTFIGDSAITIGIFLEEAGKIAGAAFKSIKTLFDGTGLGGGMMDALQGLEQLLDDMQPGIQDLGISLGILAHIASEVIKAFGPGLNQLFETIRKVLQEVQKGVEDVIPVFNKFVEALMGAAQGPIVAIADAIGNLLEGFAGMPGPIQGVIMSLGLFLMFKNKFAGFFDTLGASVKDNGDRVETKLSKMRTAFRDLAFDAKHYVGGMGSDWGLFKDKATDAFDKTKMGLKANMDQMAYYVPSKIRDMANGVKTGMSAFGDGFKQAGRDFVREFDTVRAGLARVPDNARDAAARFSAAWSNGLAKIGDKIAPADSTLRKFAENVKLTSATMGENLAPARNAFSQLAQHTQTVVSGMGTTIASGLKSVGGSLLGFLGGGWGIALMAVTAMFGEYAIQQQKHEQQVDNLAAAYEQSGGRIDAGVRKVIAANLDMKKSFFGLEFESAYETAKKAGVSLQDLTEAAAGVPGAIKKVNDQLAQSGKSATKFDFAWKGVLEGLKNSGGPLRGLADFLDKSGIFKSEGMKLAEAIAEQGRAAEEAKKQNEELAQKLGVGSAAAQKMTANFDVLRDAASSVSERVEALKSNIDLQNQSMTSTRNASRDHAKAMFDLDDAMKGLAGSGKEIIDVNGRMEDSFRNSLVTTDGMFQNNSRQAIKFSEEMDSAAESIMTLGMNEMKRLQDTGASLPAAQAGAMKVMNEQTQVLRDKLSTLGFDAGQVNAIIGQLGLNPDKMKAALVVDDKDAQAKLLNFELFKEAVLSKNWTVALEASTDDVKNAILTTDEYKKAYEDGGWEAVVKLRDETGKSFEGLFAKILTAKNEGKDIRAVLEAEFPGAKTFEEAKKQAEAYGTLDVKATMGVLDQASVPAGIASQQVLEFAKQHPEVLLKATDQTKPAIDSGIANKVMWNGVLTDPATLTAENLTGGVVVEAQSTINGLHGVIRDLEAENKTGTPTAMAQATLESLKDVVRRLEGNNATLPELQAAQRTIDSLKGKSADLTANDKASQIVTNVNNAKLNDKTFNIMGVLTGVSDAVRRALGFAKGGIIDGLGVQQFANGGVNMPNMKSFANGSENHVAQISRGQWPVRIWAEPETGGEAYLPLGKNKRARSLKILDQVADMFGYSLVKKLQFAQGGIMQYKMPSTTPSMVSGSDSVKTQVITAPAAAASAPTLITNVYPSAPLNEEQIATSVSENLYWKLTTQI